MTKVKGLQSSGYPPFTSFSEGLQRKLNQKLLKDHIYDYTMFYSLADGSGIACNQLQALFTATAFVRCASMNLPFDTLCYHNYISYQAENDTNSFMTDTASWSKINNCFIANGTEEYLTIANLRNGIFSHHMDVNRNTSFNVSGETLDRLSYYYIDDLSLYDLGYYSGAVRCKRDTTICNNSGIVIGDNIRDSSTIAWQPTAALSCTNCPNPVASPTITTTYYVTKTLCSFTTKDSITVAIHTPTARATAGNFKSICSNDTVTLGRNDSTAFSSYSWQPPSGLSCTNCPQPLATPFTSTTYTLNRTECSLSTQDTITIYVDDCEVKIPNIFTPNNDNANDEWKIKLPVGFKFTTAAVYDRWGTLVYSLDDALLSTQNSKLRTVLWDGRTTAGLECSAGVYFYVLHYQDSKGELKKMNGTISLIR